jgi:hypothetical protein
MSKKRTIDSFFGSTAKKAKVVETNDETVSSLLGLLRSHCASLC